MLLEIAQGILGRIDEVNTSVCVSIQKSPRKRPVNNNNKKRDICGSISKHFQSTFLILYTAMVPDNPAWCSSQGPIHGRGRYETPKACVSAASYGHIALLSAQLAPAQKKQNKTLYICLTLFNCHSVAEQTSPFPLPPPFAHYVIVTSVRKRME